MDGQNYLKSLHKMQIDRERLKPAVNSKSGIILESLSPQKNMLARMHSKNVTLMRLKTLIAGRTDTF